MYDSTSHTKDVGELIEELKKYPKETKVLVYVGEVEEYGNIQIVKKYKSDDEFPYSKGEEPKVTKDFLLLEGSLC